MSFMQDEFDWKRKPAALVVRTDYLAAGYAHGAVLPLRGVRRITITGRATVALVVFALLESILFAWVFGMKKGWREITAGADIRVPGVL